MSFNASLADEIIAIIMADPLRHNNATWISNSAKLPSPSEARIHCGTTCCVAGWAAVLTLDDRWVLHASYAQNAVTRKQVNYDNIGRHELGLSSSQAEWLFSYLRTQEEVLWALKWLRDHEDATYGDLRYESQIITRERNANA